MKEVQCQATQEDLCTQFRALCEELMVWREGHPGASWDEIAAQVTPRRRELMGQLLKALALQEGNGRCPEGIVCERCGTEMVYKGEALRQVEHAEGESDLQRAYYHCPHCGEGLFPPGSAAQTGAAQLDAGDDPRSLASGQ